MLGPYRIDSALGAGGMGEVYKARDSRLERTVALKVLGAAVSDNPELRARFEREARAISALNHPNICTLHDVGEHEGSPYLVMELLEGETLADRLRRGPLSFEQLVKIGIEVSDALDKAHRQGIVHRDLKPANVMLTRAGAKLLDFGLAKPAGALTASGSVGAPLLSAAVTREGPSPQLSPLTTAGAIVGTILYMSPEQIEGREADARSDIFALGTLLYEMATGVRPFEGKSQLSVASAILEKDPTPIDALQPALPAGLQRVVQTCLAKDPEDRFSSAHDVRLELGWLSKSPPRAENAPSPRPPQLRAWQLATIVSALLAIGLPLSQRRAAPASSARVIRAVIPTPDGVALEAVGDLAGPPVLSPDGGMVAFVAKGPDSPKALWVRSLSGAGAQRLDGTEEATFPFWSADSRFLGFFANGRLSKVGAAGGPVVALAPAANSRGGSWSRDNVILYAPSFQGGLSRVSALGGPVTEVTQLDAAKHTTHRWPFFLPDGKRFLFLAANHSGGIRDSNGVYLASLDGGEPRFVTASDSGGQFAAGRILFHAQSALMAQAFDPARGALSGEPQVLIDKVRHDSGIWRTLFSVSSTADLVYQTGAAAGVSTELLWLDRTGKQIDVLAAKGAFQGPRLSPDGKRLVVIDGDPGSHVWIYDLARKTSMQLSFDTGDPLNAAWSSDGTQVVYSIFDSNRIRIKNSDGSGEAATIMTEPGGIADDAQLSRDGGTLLYRFVAKGDAQGSWRLLARPLRGDGKSEVVIDPGPRSTIGSYRLSHDGKWIAYQSNESGRSEVYVTSFPRRDGSKWRASGQGGGLWPAWRPDGKELFYIGGDLKLYAVSVDPSAGQPRLGTPQGLFITAGAVFVGTYFDVSADGKRFLINRVPPEPPSPMTLLLNWPAELGKN
jgi:serine/threonine protein kinase/Tol biopolymer transport system component